MTHGDFFTDGLRLAYRDEGSGTPVLLIHGFASNMATNWETTGWFRDLRQAGFRVIAYDNRGHGLSDAPHDVARYGQGAATMAEDARALLDHLGVSSAHVVGYSMGARIGTFLALAHPQRVRSLVIGGMGDRLVTGMPGGADRRARIAAALAAEDVSTVTDRGALGFRKFAERTGGDRLALAACMRTQPTPITEEDLRRLALPVLIVMGETDEVAGSAQALAHMIRGAEVRIIPRRDHMKAPGDPAMRREVVAFLTRQEGENR